MRLPGASLSSRLPHAAKLNKHLRCGYATAGTVARPLDHPQPAPIKAA